jgi:hypothetical protein
VKGPNTEEEFQAIERLLSLERLSRYTELSGGNREKTIKLYQNNTALSEALYTPLQGLEVCLRNACSIELAILLGDTWHENTHAIFEHPVTEMIESARRSLTNDGKAITLGRMVSELNFGFWVAILAPRYENGLWRPALRKAFPNRPRKVERKEVHKSVNALRRLRNRVAHHEPILHRDLQHDHEQVLRILEWACTRTAGWIAAQSRLPAVLAEQSPETNHFMTSSMVIA